MIFLKWVIRPYLYIKYFFQKWTKIKKELADHNQKTHFLTKNVWFVKNSPKLSVGGVLFALKTVADFKVPTGDLGLTDRILTE